MNRCPVAAAPHATIDLQLDRHRLRTNTDGKLLLTSTAVVLFAAIRAFFGWPAPLCQ